MSPQTAYRRVNELRRHDARFLELLYLVCALVLGALLAATTSA
jgi:hypothetical protein